MRYHHLVLTLAAVACAPPDVSAPANNDPAEAPTTPFTVSVTASSASEVAIIPMAFDADGAPIGAGAALAVAAIEGGEARFELPARPPPAHRDASDRMTTVTYGVFARTAADEGNNFEYVAVADTTLGFVSARRAGVPEGWYLLDEDEAGNTLYDDVDAGVFVDDGDEPVSQLELRGGSGDLPDDATGAYHLGFFDALGRLSGESATVTGQWSIAFLAPPSSPGDPVLGFEVVVLLPGVFVDVDQSGEWSSLDDVVATICAGIDQVMVLYTTPPTDPATLWALKDSELVAGWGAYSERPNGLHRLVGEEMGGFMVNTECTGTP